MEFYNSDIATIANLELIQFNADQSDDKALAWVKSLSMPWPMVMKAKHKSVDFFTALGFRSLPSYALVSKDGEVVKVGRDYRALTEEGKRLIAEAAQ